MESCRPLLPLSRPLCLRPRHDSTTDTFSAYALATSASGVGKRSGDLRYAATPAAEQDNNVVVVTTSAKQAAHAEAMLVRCRSPRTPLLSLSGTHSPGRGCRRRSGGARRRRSEGEEGAGARGARLAGRRSASGAPPGADTAPATPPLRSHGSPPRPLRVIRGEPTIPSRLSALPLTPSPWQKNGGKTPTGEE